MEILNKALKPERSNVKGLKSQSGIATALLVGLIAVVLIFVAVGVYAAKNYKVWIADGITAGMNALINGSDIPEEEKADVIRIISQLKEDYLAQEISIAELGLVSDHEILGVLVTAKNFADEAEISEEMIEIDISDEFLKSLEGALGVRLLENRKTNLIICAPQCLIISSAISLCPSLAANCEGVVLALTSVFQITI